MEEVRGSSPLPPTILAVALAAWCGAVFAADLQRIGVMEPKPQYRWEAVLWLQQHDEEMQALLQARNPELAGKEILWPHGETEMQIWRGNPLVPGKPRLKVYVITVPFVPVGAAWKAGKDRRVAIGYRRKGATVNEPPGPLLPIDGPRDPAARLVYAPTIRVTVDEDGNIYF